MSVRRGDFGDAVAEVQELLNWHGFSLKVDRKFGPKTEKAVRAYQKQNGLKVDGIVGKKTMGALKEDPLKEEGYESDGEAEHVVTVNPGSGPSRYTWCLDNGHGGMIGGEYQTVGKRSPQVPPGVYEGEFNRDVVKRLVGLCQLSGIDCVDLVPEQANIKLSERVRRANAFQKKKGNCIFISIHANAAGRGGWNKARGVVTFHLKQTNDFSAASKKLAATLQKRLVKISGLRDRSVKSANFFVLRNSKMPAILSENGFMTNLKEAELLASDSYRDKVALAHFKMIKMVESGRVKLP